MATYLTRTFGTPTSTKKFTISVWVKRTTIGSSQALLQYNGDYFYFNGDALDFEPSIGRIKTNRLFRDPNAWYHIVVTADTTLATADDRFKMYVNGVQETSFASRTNPSQNADFANFNSANSHKIGQRQASPGNDLNFRGILSHYHFCDGYAYAASDFGETDSTSGIWKPKTAPSVTYGNNGFFLKFENSGAMGTDSSGNSNTFTVNGTLTQNVDTPSNNFATMNPLDVGTWTQGNVYSNGNLTLTTDNYIASNSTLAVSSGKWYWEVKLINSSASNVYAGGGVINFEGWNGGGQGGSGPNTYIYATSGQKSNNTSSSSFGDTLTAGDIVGVALDMDNGFLYFSKNGTFQNSGVPTSGSTGTGNAFSSLSGTFAAHLSDPNDSQDHDLSINFGQGFFGTTAVASANADGNGIGAFEYAVPSGYYALCTKNIKEFG